MTKKLIVLNIVALTSDLIDRTNPKNIKKLISGGKSVSIIPTFPAVTCSVQASITTGVLPNKHGIIANGYYDKKSKSVSFWEQYDSLVEQTRIWENLKKKNKNFKTALLFWQNSLFTNSDIVITPKPLHLEKKMIEWCYSKPQNFYEEISSEIGEFELKSYWGPFSSIKSSSWILHATKLVIKKQKPDLVMSYLPHLDYAAQKFGPFSNELSNSVNEIDNLLGDFVEFLKLNFPDEYEIMIISEYGFNEVSKSISPNKILREHNLQSFRTISNKEYIDFEFSKAFAMVDHQIAHIYTDNEHEKTVKDIFSTIPGISKIIDKSEQKAIGINHPKSGNLILCAEKNFWFNYYWWDSSEKAPEFTFSVDIHRKPGYDPLELFFDKQTMTISHDTNLIHGSHGIFSESDASNLPIAVIPKCLNLSSKKLPITQIFTLISDFFN